ncbi:MAG: TonB-dependent receptor [Bacteroidetes bacterium]|nr:TonB-dependent receptor [Bacteroidota bacterium]MDA0903198.1 TonB-dependent receptor [Bacteroidota bacterium]MDA1242243.1 TonB-dependent receptor [Bacteroidota bacterium]
MPGRLSPLSLLSKTSTPRLSSGLQSFSARFRLVSSLASCLFVSVASSQTTLRGRVVDGATGEPMFAANVLVDGTSNGVTTDFDGLFRVTVPGLPVTLNVSFIGYSVQQIRVTQTNQRIEVKLQADQVLMEEAEVIGERISEKQKQQPLTVETMDALAIKEAPSGSFYEGLGNLKGVDLTSASLGFKIVNTRGFNSTSPVRSLQLIDGVDNQSPGLNFSLGNFLGAPDLDVKNVEIVAGASSAYFGPGAFNGVINMETKDPFVHQGFSASYRMGERNLFEGGFRWADSFENAAGDDVFAYKINAFAFSAYDWEATNYNPVDASQVDASNPGRFDAVNIYGDEYSTTLDYGGDNSVNARGLGTLFRTGYREIDLVDYNTDNLKVSLSGSWRLQPDKTYESPELIYGFNMGRGTTVYQGDNRFSLRDIEFYQHKVELRKKGDWFIRAYRTSEDAGNSYDPYATALKIQDSLRSDYNWSKVYYAYWIDSIAPQIDDTYPNLEIIRYDTLWIFPPDIFTLIPVAGYPEGSEDAWYADNAGNLQTWHSQVENWTNNGYAGLADVASEPLGFAAPGTPEFDQLFQSLITKKNNDGEGGTRFFDESSLVHVHGEKIFKPWWVEEIRLGANARRYTPDSDGTIFSDTNGRVITNQEIGLYTGIKRRFLDDKLITTATVRADKNQNFPWVVSPAASLVWTPTPTDFLRLSFSSALRNPTLADQYLYLDVGPATLVGNLNGATDLVTIQSFVDYRNSSSGVNIGFNLDTLVYFDIAPLVPEQVRTIEAGYRTTLGEKLYMDANYYFSWYTNFIGYNIGLDVLFQNPSFPDFITGVDVYRYAANSLNKVQTQGASLGLNYFLGDRYTLSGNYSWNKLVKTDENDPIIPAFNTPEHKFNLGLTARGLKGRNKDVWGFGANYRWVQGFVFEGSPQFTGFVPSYDLVDAQINYKFDSQGLTVKLGGSNLLQNLHIETYGGPTVGRLAYVSLALDVD